MDCASHLAAPLRDLLAEIVPCVHKQLLQLFHLLLHLCSTSSPRTGKLTGDARLSELRMGSSLG